MNFTSTDATLRHEHCHKLFLITVHQQENTRNGNPGSSTFSRKNDNLILVVSRDANLVALATSGRSAGAFTAKEVGEARAQDAAADEPVGVDPDTATTRLLAVV